MFLAVQNSIGHQLFTMGEPILSKVIRTIAIYLGLLFLLRVAGKRDLAQLNSGDLVVLLLLSNVVQNAVIGEDNSVWGGMIGAATLIAVNGVVDRLANRRPDVARVLEGAPTEIVHDGALDEAAMRHVGLRESEVIAALRRQGADTLDQVRLATLDPGGAIWVELYPSDMAATKGDIDRLDGRIAEILARLPGTP
jgi:uncharacterized membrane protein YcaP (DUF421 family)